MRADTLVFDGTAFPAVTVTGALATATSTGRRWHTDKPLAFWRTFAKLDLNAAPDVEMLVARYGDPSGLLPDAPTHPPLWKDLQDFLASAAEAWEAEDDDGISRLTVDPERWHRARLTLIGDEAERVTYNLRLVPDRATGGRIAHADSLGAFMAASAGAMFATKTPMRRCLECGHWTDASHKATRYCSNACLVRASRRRKEIA